MATALDTAESEWSTLLSLAHQLPAIWTGHTGAEALTMLDTQLRRAREDLDTARSALTALSDMAAPLRSAALTKAEQTLALLTQTPHGTPKPPMAQPNSPSTATPPKT
ncbi:hypothetical protein [Nocardia crassostreae]|uniref:hypothetical protein n=1 Tax=Nocardia crassostreae TaxID=53428 RepID=UPI00082C2180|nr:hypothetical protein [Nocardia crassostreae]